MTINAEETRDKVNGLRDELLSTLQAWTDNELAEKRDEVLSQLQQTLGKVQEKTTRQANKFADTATETVEHAEQEARSLADQAQETLPRNRKKQAGILTLLGIAILLTVYLTRGK